MNKTKTLLFAGLATAAMFAGQVYAIPVNEPPPPDWIINLDGQRVPRNPDRYVQYTAYFIALQTTTHITFAMRDDTFESIALDNIAVADIYDPGVNLIRNGGFEDGTAPSGGNPSAPVDWQYLNPYGALEESVVSCGQYGQGGSNCSWGSGTTGAFDLITQPIPTVIGNSYEMSFWALGPDEGNYWNLNCCVSGPVEGVAFDLVAYAGTVPISAVPEPAALGMFGLGVLLIGGFVALRGRKPLSLQA